MGDKTDTKNQERRRLFCSYIGECSVRQLNIKDNRGEIICMNKGILSLAIAVPTVLFTTLPSLADIVKTPVNNSVSTSRTSVIQIQAVGQGTEGKGEVGAVPKGGRGPKPPKREVPVLSQIGNVGTPAINVRIQNIKTAPAVR